MVYGDGVPYTEERSRVVPAITNLMCMISARECRDLMAAPQSIRAYIAGQFIQYGSPLTKTGGGLYQDAEAPGEPLESIHGVQMKFGHLPSFLRSWRVHYGKLSGRADKAIRHAFCPGISAPGTKVLLFGGISSFAYFWPTWVRETIRS